MKPSKPPKTKHPRPPRLYAPAFDFPDAAEDQETLASLLDRNGAGSAVEYHPCALAGDQLLRVCCKKHPDAPTWPYFRSDAKVLSLVCATCKAPVIDVFNGTRLPFRPHQEPTR